MPGIAGLLHDAIEDAGVSLKRIQSLFGERVAHIVDTLTEDKSIEDVAARKADYINRVYEAALNDPEVLLVCLADKVHNGHSYLRHPHMITAHVVEFYSNICNMLHHLEPDGGWVKEPIWMPLSNELSDIYSRMKERFPSTP